MKKIIFVMSLMLSMDLLFTMQDSQNTQSIENNYFIRGAKNMLVVQGVLLPKALGFGLGYGAGTVAGGFTGLVLSTMLNNNHTGVETNKLTGGETALVVTGMSAGSAIGGLSGYKAGEFLGNIVTKPSMDYLKDQQLKKSIGEKGEAAVWATQAIGRCTGLTSGISHVIQAPVDLKTAAAGCTLFYAAFVAAAAVINKDL